MEKQITQSWYMFLIKGIILVVLSLFVFIFPQGTLKTIAVCFGIGLFISGILLVIRNISVKKPDESINWNTIEGIADLILGFLLVVAPLVMAAIIPVLVGIWAVFYGVLIIIDSARGNGNAAMKLASGVLILLLACILIFKPLFLGLTIVIWLGILLLVAGIFNITFAVKLKKTNFSK